MVSSEGDVGMGDSGIGTIVWVRRRNGSWWPGKILGPKELSASHLMSPRSGTPVNLLGREDASVDWYNLEKSKRVKPFRCGEFDDCIQRAEASQGMPPKKREKYARREDAILHALELEKQAAEKKYGKLLPLAESSKKDKDVDVAEDSYVHLRMRDLGLVSNGSHKHDETSLGKRRRSHMEEPLGKRHRPLVQVLENTAKSALVIDDAPIANLDYKQTFHNQVQLKTSTPNSERRGLSEDNTTEDTETDSSGTESLISDTYHAINTLSDEGEHIEFIPKEYGRCEDGSMSEEEESGEAVLKWQLKGKRKSRSVTKRKAMMIAGHWMSFIKGGGGGGEDTSEDEDEERGCWEEFRMLIDVDVGVQSGYQREHVPMISLMRKLNDKAIVGHPIPIEPLEDGSILLDFQTLGYDAALQPWRTARRTAKCRLPRPPTLEEEEETPFEYYNASNKGRKWPAPPKKRTNSSFTTQKIRTLSLSLTPLPCLPTARVSVETGGVDSLILHGGKAGGVCNYMQSKYNSTHHRISNGLHLKIPTKQKSTYLKND